eukprot:Skav206395  [mRNA]  locus=scaffold690:51418:63732:- [translate_table: standard]
MPSGAMLIHTSSGGFQICSGKGYHSPLGPRIPLGGFTDVFILASKLTLTNELPASPTFRAPWKVKKYCGGVVCLELILSCCSFSGDGT